MRAVVQRVSQASVSVDGEQLAAIGQGLLILLGCGHDDAQADVAWLSGKLARLRIFPDEAGRMNRSLVDIGGAALVVSQFTLFADAAKGNRPSFTAAAPPAAAEALYEDFCQALEAQLGCSVGRGRFAAHMMVDLVNDGPVTIVIDSQQR